MFFVILSIVFICPTQFLRQVQTLQGDFECCNESCEVYPVGDGEVLEKIKGADTSLTPERWTLTGERGRTYQARITTASGAAG